MKYEGRTLEIEAKYHGEEISKSGLRPPAESIMKSAVQPHMGKHERGRATYRGGLPKQLSNLVVAHVRAAFGRPPYIPDAYDKRTINTNTWHIHHMHDMYIPCTR